MGLHLGGEHMGLDAGGKGFIEGVVGASRMEDVQPIQGWGIRFLAVDPG